MSAPSTVDKHPATNPTPTSRRRPRGVFWIVLILAALVTALATLVFNPASSTQSLNPDNPAPRGAQAVARVLEGQGVSVTPSDTLQSTLKALEAGGGRATLLLHDEQQLLTAENLKLLASATGRTVLIEPGQDVLKAFAPDLSRVHGNEGQLALPASCAAPLATAAPVLAATGSFYTGADGCYPLPGGNGGTTATAMAISGTVTVLGSGEYLNNRGILSTGRSALALWTLGQEPNLIWYQPAFAESSAEGAAANPFMLLPAWFGPVMAWALLMGLAAMFWRGRRLGPLVAENLPVVVPAAELVHGRARMYTQGRSLDALTANLRSGALSRIAHHYRLGATASVDQIIAAIEPASVRTTEELTALLHPDITSDQELVRWANDLAQLEKDIGSP